MAGGFVGFITVASAVLLLDFTAVNSAAPKRMNFVTILTADQDFIQNSTHPRYQPKLHEHIRYPGVELNNYFITTPASSPSRTNLWRGQFSHNSNFTDVLSPHGDYSEWKSLGIDQSYLPVWLQGLGYNTFHVGMFLAEYSVNNYKNVPAGWTDFDALVSPYIFDYNNPGFSRNGAAPNLYPGQYSTDVIAEKAAAQIKAAAAAGQPFFVQIAPIGPHASTQMKYDPAANITKALFYPPVPAPRHWDLFSDATLPKAQNNLYEADVSDKPAWIRALPLALRNNRTYLEEVYRLRLRALASVDELIDSVVTTLRDVGVLDNTYIIYTSDNGYHVGTHRFGAGKVTAYNEDLRVPFLIRGPGIKASKSTKPANSKLGLHVDFAPTILALAGAGEELADKALDGIPLALYDNDDGTLHADYPRPIHHRNQFLSEFWGRWSDEMLHHIPHYAYNSWKAVRVYDEDSREAWKLIVSCTNERELYDLARDPGELNNIYPKVRPHIRNRLEALLAVLAVCKGEGCTNPWKVLHPYGSVTSWNDSLDTLFNEYYAGLRPFQYKACLPYQDYDNEVSEFRSGMWSASAAITTRSTYDNLNRKLGGTKTGSLKVATRRGDGKRWKPFYADVERHAVSAPLEVLALGEGFDPPLVLS